MFFIAYLVDVGEHIVVPASWVHNYMELIQKFIRKSINSNQKCLIYFSKKTIDGIPDGEIDANFTAPSSNVFPSIGEEACFIAKITHYFNAYDEAQARCDRLRSQPPALYNEERLYEQPIPITTVNPDNDDEHNNSVSSTVNDDTEEQENIAGDENENGLNPVDDTNVSTTVEEDEIPLPSAEVFLETNVNGTAEMVQSSEVELDPIKVEPELQLDEDERDRLDEILNFSDEISNSNDDVSSTSHVDNNESDNDVVWIGDVEKFPQPMAATIFGLTKQENDPISMSMSFNEKRNGDRIYQVGKFLKVVPAKVLKAIRAWGTYPFKNKEVYDEKIVHLLLLVLHYNQSIDGDKKSIEEFVNFILGIRIGSDPKRRENVPDYVKAYLD